MKKVDAISYILLVLAMIIMVVFIVYKVISNNTDAPLVANVEIKRMNVKNMTYTIGGNDFYLVDGIASRTATSSGEREVVKIFRGPLYGDLNNDKNKKDAALVLTSSKGEGETLYYAVFAIASSTKYTASEALFLGYGIDFETMKIVDGNVLYTYKEIPLNEEATTSSSTVKSILVHYDNFSRSLGELVKDFEGEADPDRMSLSMKKWEWIKTQLNDGTTIEPNKSGVFSITFNKDGTVNIKTDCNAMLGEYTVKEKTLTFGPLASTKMYCEGSQEQMFAQTLSNINGFLFTSRGELILEIKMGSGTMVFR